MPMIQTASLIDKRFTTRLKNVGYKDWFWAIIFLAPNLAGFIIFTVWPVFMTFYLSLCNYDILSPTQFVGIQNYANLMQDDTFITVLRNTFVYTFGTVPVGIILSLFLAIAMDNPIRGIRFYRAAYFIPVISSMVSIGVVWMWLYNPEFGLVNFLLSLVGIKGPNWIGTESTAMFSVVIVAIWKGLGYNMLLFLSGLQNISSTYYEAADIDGASWWTKFTKITLPLLTPTTFFITVMAFINSFQVFDLVQLMTKGGPGRATSVIVHYLYQNAFDFFKMGYASAIAYVLFFIVFAITIIQLIFQKKWVHYR